MAFHEAAGVAILLYLLIFGASTVLGLSVICFWIWMLVDCLKYEKSEGNDKIVWMLVIVLTNWIGALIYFFVRRPERKRLQHQLPPVAPP